MRKLLLQLDDSRLPSVFDRVVAYDGGADEVMSYGGVVPDDVRALIHGAIFTRGPKDLASTAGFIGGADMAAGEALLAAAREAFFGPFRISLMLDPNGSNTTAVAAVAKILASMKDVAGARVVITGGTGPVGARAAGLLARAGADVIITSRKPQEAEARRAAIAGRFGGRVDVAPLRTASDAEGVLRDATILLNAGPAGVTLVPRAAWANRAGLRIVVDLSAVPPPGIEGVDAGDDGAQKEGAAVFGALAVGRIKMKIHKACIARLFERNDLVLDAETIADLAQELLRPRQEA
jgi:hypothetical protein